MLITYLYNVDDKNGTIWIALPAMDEMGFIEACFDSLEQQECQYPLFVVICVNQPDDWWQRKDRITVCHENKNLLMWLSTHKERYSFGLHIIDRSSPGNGWTTKEAGVGMARKVCMDYIVSVARNSDVIVSLDADTLLDHHYLRSVMEKLQCRKDIIALSTPYYHSLTGSPAVDRALIRYECYLRTYLINMISIRSPYAFTALGAAIVVRVESYRKIGGITPKPFAEDFYLLQKLAKSGTIGLSLGARVYPSARLSSRVMVGTGPALMSGVNNDWQKYPIFHPALFLMVQKLYDSFPLLFEKHIETQADVFIEKLFGTVDIWSTIRNNSTSVHRFVNALHQRFDGLRIFQWLRYLHQEYEYPNDVINLRENIRLHHGFVAVTEGDFNFINTAVDTLSEIRDLLFEIETQKRIFYDA